MKCSGAASTETGQQSVEDQQPGTQKGQKLQRACAAIRRVLDKLQGRIRQGVLLLFSRCRCMHRGAGVHTACI